MPHRHLATTLPGAAPSPSYHPSQVPAINQLPYGVGFSGYYGGNAASVLEANRKRGVLVQALTRT